MDVQDRLVERLLCALGAQLESTSPASLTPAAVKELADLTRPEARAIYAHLGHLIHYDGDLAGLRDLMRLIGDAQRAAAPPGNRLRPGDMVRLTDPLPPHLTRYEAGWVRQQVWTVRFVGLDGTVDVQPSDLADYLVETVPTGCVIPA